LKRPGDGADRVADRPHDGFGLFPRPINVNRLASQHSLRPRSTEPISNRQGVLHLASELRKPNMSTRICRFLPLIFLPAS
jgi:hypothetical protein